MITLELPAMSFPAETKPSGPSAPASAEVNDAWQMENLRVRRERGDVARSAAPVRARFELSEPLSFPPPARGEPGW
jgi:hypothetical protein